MKRDVPRRGAFVVIALVLLASVVIGSETPARRDGSAPARSRAAQQPPAAVENLELQRLGRQRSEVAVTDLFAVQVASPAPATSVPPPAAPKVEPVSAPMAPPLPFTYLGRIVRGGRQIAYLLHRDEMIVAEAGDVIEAVYRIEGVTDSDIQFVYLPLGMRQVLSIPVSH